MPPEGEATDSTCLECGDAASHEHHVVPRSRGGTATVPLCERCHGLVHGLDMSDHKRLTRAALAGAKRRGVKLGGDALGWTRTRHVDQNGRRGVVYIPTEQRTVARIVELREQGLTLRAIASQLADEGRETKRGGRWHATTVSNVLKRQASRAQDSC